MLWRTVVKGGRGERRGGEKKWGVFCTLPVLGLSAPVPLNTWNIYFLLLSVVFMLHTHYIERDVEMTLIS